VSVFVFEHYLHAFLPLMLILLAGSLAFALSSNKSSMASVRVAAVGTAVTMLYVVQPFLASSAAELFTCLEFGPAGDQFLSADLAIRCWQSPKHAELVVLGCGMIIVYVVGAPSYMWYQLSSRRSTVERVHVAVRLSRRRSTLRPLAPSLGPSPTALLPDSELDFGSKMAALPADGQVTELTAEERQFQTDFAFLFLGYKLPSYLWEVVVTLRKTSLYIAGAAFRNNKPMLATTAVLLLAVSLTLHARRLPFIMPVMNALEFFSLSISLVTFALGLLLAVRCDNQTVCGEGSAQAAFLAKVPQIMFGLQLAFAAVATGVLVYMLRVDRQFYFSKLAGLVGADGKPAIASDGVELAMTTDNGQSGASAGNQASKGSDAPEETFKIANVQLPHANEMEKEVSDRKITS
jgi:hypothetical protein